MTAFNIHAAPEFLEARILLRALQDVLPGTILAGGAVRDGLLGRADEIRDFDFFCASDEAPEEVVAKLQAAGVPHLSREWDVHDYAEGVGYYDYVAQANPQAEKAWGFQAIKFGALAPNEGFYRAEARRGLCWDLVLVPKMALAGRTVGEWYHAVAATATCMSPSCATVGHLAWLSVSAIGVCACSKYACIYRPPSGIQIGTLVTQPVLGRTGWAFYSTRHAVTGRSKVGVAISTHKRL